MKEKLLIILLIMMFVMSSCSKKETGDIEIAPSEEAETIVLQDGGDLLFGPGEPKSGYTEYDDKYAGLVISYPEDWNFEIAGPEFLYLSDDNNIILIHHKLHPDDSDAEDMEEFLNGFDSMAENERFSFFGYWNLQRRENQELTEMKVVSDDPLLIRKTFDDVRFRDDMQRYLTGICKERRYCFRYNGIDTMISSFGPDADVIDHIIKNLKTSRIEITGKTSIFMDGDFVILPGSFEKVTAGKEKYYVPDDHFAGCFAAVLPGGKELSEGDLDALFGSVFEGEFHNTYGSTDFPLFPMSKAFSCNISGNLSFPPVGMTYTIETNELDDAIVIIAYPKGKRPLLEAFLREN